MSVSLFETRYEPQRSLGNAPLGEVFAAVQRGRGAGDPDSRRPTGTDEAGPVSRRGTGEALTPPLSSLSTGAERGGTTAVSLVIERPVTLYRCTRLTESQRPARRSFIDGMRHAVALIHPNILRVLDVGEEDGAYYVVSDRVEGRSLRHLAAAAQRLGRALPLEAVVSIIRQVLEGLAYARRFRDAGGRRVGLVHGTLAPSRVVVSIDGVAMISGFGLGAAERRLWRRQVPPEIESYWAPEVRDGDAPDHRGDIFSVGALLYDLSLAGRVPALLTAQRDNREGRYALPPTFVSQDYPPALELIVMRALEPHPEERFESAEEMLDELDGFCDAARLHSSPASLARHVRGVLHVRDRRALDIDPDTDELDRREQAVLGSADDDLALATRSGTKSENPAGRHRRRLGEAQQLAAATRAGLQSTARVPMPLEHTVMVTADLVEAESELEEGESDFLIRASMGPGAASAGDETRRSLFPMRGDDTPSGPATPIFDLGAEDEPFADEAPPSRFVHRAPPQRRALKRQPPAIRTQQNEHTMELALDDLLDASMGDAEPDLGRELADALSRPRRGSPPVAPRSHGRRPPPPPRVIASRDERRSTSESFGVPEGLPLASAGGLSRVASEA